MTAVLSDVAAVASVAPARAPESLASDPHAATKLAPDDPRLALRRGGRTLRSGPLVALAAALSGVVVLAAALAFETPKKSAPGKDSAAASATPAAPVVPETIRNASAHTTASTAAHPEPASEPEAHRATAGVTEASSEEKLRQDQTFRADNAPILFERMAGGGGEESPLGPGEPRAPALTAPPTERAAGPSDSDPNGQLRKNAFVDGHGGANTADYAGATVQHPRSPYELQAGTVIPAVLITAINSDLPGPVVGQVRENVYDTVSGNTLLVPQGARLLANYDSMVAWGQERVLLCWNRLLFPNGDSLDLQCMPAADLQGAAGLTDSVDEHWLRIIKGAAVASLLAATTQGIAGSTTGFNPSVPQIWASNAAGDINQVGQQLTRRNLSIQPTITVRPGYSVNVMVTRDLVIPPYLDATRTPGAAR
ncbi:MAG TPA: TrbI/VirB10 family protein [Polyangiaceae bacterium]|jgi:type IV secretion system protein VirB10